MSERDKKLLIYLGSVIILAAAYFLVGKPYLDKYNTLLDEKVVLETELAQKQEAYGKQQFYADGIKEAVDGMNKIMDKFPEDNSDEKSIMFASRAEADVPIWFSQMTFATETESFVNGGQIESASDIEAEALNESVEAVENEAGEVATESTTEAAVAETSDENAYTGINDLVGRDTELSLSYQVQYEEFKKFLAYIRDYEDRIVIKEISALYSQDSGLVSGNMTLSQYAILGDDRVLPDVITGLDDELLGKDNVFTSENYGGTIIDILLDIASDFLNLIMGNYDMETISDQLGTDYFINVGGVTDNTNGVTVGRANDPEGKTYITSDKNSSQDVIVKINGSNGEYTVTYKLSDSEYKDTIKKDIEGKLYLRVISSERMNKDDKVEISLHVSNASDIPVVVNVECDDSDNPRIFITERNGDVSVNN